MPAGKYKLWAWGGPVGQGVTESHHVGVAGIAKSASPNMPYTVATEYLCGEIGRALRLPIPPGFIVEREQVKYHVSLNFNLAGESLPPADAVALVETQPYLACGIIAFDAWIMNPDRHARNLAYDKTTSAAAVFDHSHAFIGLGKARLTEHANSLGIGRHCVAMQLKSIADFDTWIERINGVPEWYIREVIRDTVSMGLGENDVDFCTNYLLNRRKELKAIIQNSKAVFPNVQPDLWAA